MAEPRTTWTPPAVAFEPELVWLLGAAFASEPGRAGPDLDRGRILELAVMFSLAPRIVGRLGRRRLVEELGLKPGWMLLQRALEMGKRSNARVAAIREIDRVASGAGIRLVLLKFGALVFGGFTLPEQRGAADVDVLVDEGDLGAFTEVFAREGWAADHQDHPDHHEPALKHGTHGTLELHHRLPGIGLRAAESFLRMGGLHAGGHLIPAPGLSPFSTIPSRPILVAHVLAHGFAQHGHAPWTYPMLRVVADLQDLGVTEHEVREGSPICEWLSPCLPPDDVRAAVRLVKSLESGDRALFEKTERASGERTLLRHLVAGVLDPDYAKSLSFEMISRIATGRARHHSLGRVVLRQLFPSARALEVYYGPGRHPARILALRFYRPIDLAMRAVRHGARMASLRLGLPRNPGTTREGARGRP